MNLIEGISLSALLFIGIANGFVGFLIGICGIAGFLLPIAYTGALGYSVDEALAFSFLAFLFSAGFGSLNYWRAGNLDIPMSVKLGIGSFAGAITGVYLQAAIPKDTAKLILYLVVLFSGLSILYRVWKERKCAEQADCAGEQDAPAGGQDDPAGRQVPLAGGPVGHDGRQDIRVTGQTNWLLLPLLGLVTGAVCSLSGAGGPVLVMPLLILLGVPTRVAVGVALFDSLFIAVPACLGYLARIDVFGQLPLLLFIVITHGIGVLIGSQLSGKIPANTLKTFVAVFSVGISIYMLL